MENMQVPIILTFISIIILLFAIKNVYKVKQEINSVKNRKTLNFIRFNIAIAVSFIVGYLIFIICVIFEVHNFTMYLTAVLFSLTAIFSFIASIVTYKMGKLLFKIDTIRKLDSMTKVYNHLQIKRVISKEFNHCRRYQRNASLVMLDINKFKSINDIYGHQAGDKVILDLVATINSEARDTDTLGRYGGDEFILVMPETTMEMAKKFSQRITSIIRDKKIEYEGDIITYDVSIGVSAVNFNQSNYENWLRIADKDLYQSKASVKLKTL